MSTAEPYTKPLPKIRPVDEPYWAATSAGEFRLQHCSNCGKWRFPPEEICPRCLSDKYEWEIASGKGKLWSWIIMHQEYFKGFHDDLPYNVAFIELDEGPMMMSNIVRSEPQNFSCGAPVEVVLDRVTDDLVIPRFRLL